MIRRVAAKAPESDVEDVPGYMLSIEEWRAKVEQDEINRLAGEAKNELLSQLEEIRKKIASLIEENKTRERNMQLAPEDFVIDPRLRRLNRAPFCVVFVFNCRVLELIAHVEQLSVPWSFTSQDHFVNAVRNGEKRLMRSLHYFVTWHSLRASLYNTVTAGTKSYLSP